MMYARIAAASVIVCAACDRTSSSIPAAHAVPAAVKTAAVPVPRAESLYFAGEYDSAASLWKHDLDSATQSKDSLRQATTLMWLGLASWRRGDNATGRRLGEQSLELKKKLSGNPDLSRSYNALGLLARDEGRLRDAASMFEQAVATARAVADTPGVSRAAANIALIHLELGDFDRARQGFEAAREAGRAMGDERVEGNALNNLGMLTIRLGDPASAVPLINDALVRYRSIEYTTGEQSSLAQLASAYDLLGEPQRALALLDSASRIARASDMRSEEAGNLRLMGEIHQTMSDHRRALEFFSRSRALSRELGLRLEEAMALRVEAASHLALGRTDLARARTRDAVAIHRKEGAAWAEFGDLLLLAELASIANDRSEASARIGEARGLALRLNTPAARGELALSEARIAANERNWPAVLRTLDRGQNDLAKARADIAWEAPALRARAHARMGQLDSAYAAGRDAIAAAERVRGRIGSAGLRTGFTSARAAIYADQVIVLLRLGRTAEAFEVADAARGRALVEHLAEARSGGVQPQR